MMSEAAMLFNGIQYSFNVIEKAFSWAKLSKGRVKAIFLRAENEPGEGYIFPSDLDAAENLSSTDDAKAGYVSIIQSNVRMLEHAAATEHVDLYTTVLIEPSEKKLLEELENSERIFVNDDVYTQGIMTVDSINLKEFITNPPVPVEIVKSPS